MAALTSARCATCGTAFEKKRENHRYCGTPCRQRANRSGAARESGRQGAGVEEATRRELDAAKATESVLGRTALVLARRLDLGGDAGSVVAALARELRATIEAATRGGETQKDPVAEIGARRRRRLGFG